MMMQYIRKKWRVVLYSAIAGAIMPYFTCNRCSDSFEFYLWISVYTFVIWMAMWLGNEAITVWLDKKLPWTKKPVLRLLAGITCTFVYTVFMLLLLRDLFVRISNIPLGNTSGMIYFGLAFSFFFTFFFTSRWFLLNWRQSEIDAEKLKKESISAQYESLKNQVNPHFLFNSFNVLSHLVYEDQEKAVKFIKQLSTVYRYVLDTREKELVSLDDELAFLESYIFLQQIRFESKLDIQIALSGVVSFVAPLALQMLIENAIKHNVVSADDPLHIRIYSEEGFICVENNLQKKRSNSEPSAGVGLENICKRYEFLTERKAVITKTKGLFIVKLPMIKE
ncbi:MAG TPA: histidine kinase [Ohtaekwangia sp.]|nr:histidine kinase [Ohtaekwangia sp.]